MACPTGNEPELNEEVVCIYGTWRDRVWSICLQISSWILFQTRWVGDRKYSCLGSPQEWLHRIMCLSQFHLFVFCPWIVLWWICLELPLFMLSLSSTSILTSTPLALPPGLLNKNNIYLSYLLILSVQYWFCGCVIGFIRWSIFKTT